MNKLREHKNLLLTVAAVLLALILGVLLWPKGSAPSAETPFAEPAATPQVISDEGAGKIIISELMVKNRATLQDETGAFPDWIELENIADTAVDLEGWCLSDAESKSGWAFPAVSLTPGQRLIVYADGSGQGLHADFSLSEGETVYLYNKYGYLLSTAPCLAGTADVSTARCADGSYTESLYPTPGYPNDAAGYDARQETLGALGPLAINEVVVSSATDRWATVLGESDWVELKNISGDAVRLADYWVSDDMDELLCWQLPDVILQPSELYLIRCDTSEPMLGMAVVCPAFNLNASAEQLYLSREDGTLVDFVPLRDIPYGGSYGRADGENGWFFFPDPSPGTANKNGCRRVSAAPVALSEDGVFDGVDSVTVSLAGDGVIYYTTDSSLPGESGSVYTEPFQVSETGIVRAVAVQDGALPSRPLTLSYILNEEHVLPVVSLVSNDHNLFSSMYVNAWKNLEIPGSLSLYDENGGFTVPCGIRMHGETSLVLSKKNMSVHLRGAYGQDSVDYDVFGGGITEFSSFVLRSGQDYNRSIIRNELCENLALAASDNVVAERNKYCILYVDGKYFGIYALTEKVNEAMYARRQGVSKNSVTVIASEVSVYSDLYRDVFAFCQSNDMSLPENYEEFCRRMDVDSLIDWILLEGWCANADLTYGNLRYCRSTEGDGKWRLMFYDLDSTLSQPEQQFANMFSNYALANRQVSQIIKPLLKNEAFVDRLLTRAGELLSGPLSDERTLAEIDRLTAQIAPEVARDYGRFNLEKQGWKWNVEWLRNFITVDSWQQHGIDTLCWLFDLDAQQREHYFG